MTGAIHRAHRLTGLEHSVLFSSSRRKQGLQVTVTAECMMGDNIMMGQYLLIRGEVKLAGLLNVMYRDVSVRERTETSVRKH